MDEIKCTKCRLYKTTTRVKIDSVIPDKFCGLCFIAEAPGEAEEDQGVPLVGAAGRNFDSALEKSNIDRKTVMIGNVMKCRPPGNRAPHKDEITQCLPYLIEELKAAQPKVIVCLGLVAAKAVLRNQGLKMTEVHGRKYNGRPLLGFECIIIPSWHPSPRSMDNNPHRMQQMIQDFRTAKLILDEGTELKKEKSWNSITVDSYDSWQKVFNILKQKHYIVFDLETTGLEFLAGDALITNVGLASDDTFGVSVVCAPKFEGFEKFVEELKWLIESKKIIAHHMTFDAKYIKKQWDIWPNHWFWDTSLGHAVLKPGESTRLKDITWMYTEMGGYEYDLAQYGGLMKANAYERAEYNIDDVIATAKIAREQIKKLKGDYRYKLLQNIVFPAASLLSEMEYKGVLIDQYKLAELDRKYTMQLREIKNQLYMNGTIMKYNQEKQAFNPRSNKQLREVLFDPRYCGYSPIEGKVSERTRQPSTDKFVLKKLKNDQGSEICGLVLEHSRVAKLHSTYIKGTREKIIGGRVHPKYHLDTTRSGRTSSDMQQIPKDSDIKSMIVPDPGCKFIDLDYKQMELVVSVFYTEDEIMKEAIQSGDAHSYIAKLIFGLNEVDDENRRFVKTLNFGVLYGMGAGKLADSLEIHIDDAQKFIDQYFELMKKTKEWIKGIRRRAEVEGISSSLFGRIRTYKKKKDLKKDEKEEYNSAVNHPIQSLASDLVLYGMLQWKKYLVEQGYYLNGAHISLQVHDSVTTCIREDLLDKLIIPMKQVFESIKFPFMTLPLTIEMEIGDNWGEMKKINF